MRRRWLSFRYRLEFHALHLAAWLVPKFSRHTCLRLARCLGRLYHLLDRRSRAVALANLEAAFPGRYDLRERHRIARASAQNLARTFLDLFWSRRLTLDNYRRWMKITDHGALQPIAPKSPGRILMCQHFGNFEWMGLAAGFHGIDIPVIEQEFRNRALGPIFDRARTISGNTTMPRRGAMVRVFKHLQHGGFLGLLPDLTLRPGRSSTVVTFLGLEMSVTAMPAELQLRTGCKLHPAISLPQPDGTCELIYFEQLPARNTVPDITQQLWDFYEPWVREHPHLWIWHYKHWRYRPAQAAPAAYPFYANVSPHFEKARARAAELGKIS